MMRMCNTIIKVLVIISCVSSQEYSSLRPDSSTWAVTRAQPVRMETDTESSSTTEPTEPPPKVCGIVRQLNHTIDGTKVMIEWFPPDGSYCNGDYLFTLLDFDTSEVLQNKTINETKIDIDSLEPCGNYVYTITAFNMDNELGESNEKALKLEAIAPSMVTNLEYQSTSIVENASTSVVISWKEPEIGKKCAKDYEVIMWRRDRESEEEDPNIIASNITATTISHDQLTACENYVVEVTPIVNATMRGFTNRLEMEMEARLTVAPDITDTASFGPTYLNISTSNNDIKSICYPTIARFTCTYEGNDTEAEKYMFTSVLIERPTDPKYFAVFEDLLPYSKYECKAMLFNVKGWSNASFTSGVHLTEQAVPDRPTEILVNETKATSFRVSWNAPEKANGILRYYRVHVQLVKPMYTIVVSDNCPPLRIMNVSFVEASTDFSRIVDELNPNVDYSVQVAATNDKGVGDYSDTKFIITKPAPSQAVQNMDFEGTPPTSVTEYNAVYTVKWDLPCRLNGNLKGFILSTEGTRLNYETHALKYIIDAKEATNYSFAIKDFKPSYIYNVSIVPVTEGVDTNLNTQNNIFFTTDPGVPKANGFQNWGYIDTSTTPNPTKTAHVTISNRLLRSEEGQISFIAILLSEQGCQLTPPSINGLLNQSIELDWPETLSWHDVQGKDCIPQYQTTKKRWTVENENNPITFTMGMGDCSNDFDYCNGPLKPGTRYAVIVRIFTTTGYSDTQYLEFETDSLVALLLIVTSISALLLSSFVIGLLILYKKGMCEPSPGLTILPGIDEINGKNFIERYNELTANKNEKLVKEYKTIDADTAIMENCSFNAARQNSSKNRYSNIHPFDHNRVVLSMDDGDTDYINASYIDGFKQEREYVACQGPKPETCNDFWRMILELKVESIVMLTSFKEGNKIKCAEYFPVLNEFNYYDDIIVRCIFEHQYDTYKKRIFVVEKGNDASLEVTHYHFLKWLDHDCPKYPYELIKFVKQVRTDRKVLDVPLVVHCSAGVGRTGTFIALDIIMQKIKEDKRLNIYEIVKQLRTQRVKMVQTPGQYIYLYKCVYELMKKEKNWTQRLLEKLMRPPENETIDDEKFDCNTIMAELSPKPNGTKTENGRIMSSESHI